MTQKARVILGLVLLLNFALLVVIHELVVHERLTLAQSAADAREVGKAEDLERALREDVRQILDARRERMTVRLQEVMERESLALPPELRARWRDGFAAEVAAAKVADQSHAQVFTLPRAPQAEESVDGEAPRGTRHWLLLPLGLVTAASLLWWWHAHWTKPMRALEASLAERGCARSLPSDELTRAFAPALLELRDARQELERRVDAKTGQLARALEVQREQKEELARLLRDLEAAREQLVRQEKLAAIGTLAAGVAHEFNNILGGVRGCAREALAHKPSTDVAECLDMIVRATERGRGIVDGLGQLGQKNPRVAQAQLLGPIVNETLRFLRPAAVERSVRLEAHCDHAPAVFADALAVQQMCTNLVKNAIEASPAQGLVRISAEVHEGSVQVSVDDEGDGVAAAHQARLYEPFFTTREKSGGTGLGLAVTHGLALAQGGTTGYAPRTPRGSRFWFEVPLANKPS